MAAAYNTGGINGVADGGSTTIDSPSIVVPSSSVVYVIIESSDGSPADPSGVVWDPTGANQALTKLGATLTFGGFAKASLYRIIAPTAGTAVFRGTYSASQGERLISVWVGTGIDTTTPNGTIATATGTNGTPSTGAMTTTVGQRVVAMAAQLTTSGAARTFDSPTGTERHEGATSGTAYDSAASQDFAATTTSTTLQWTITSSVDGWAIFGIPLADGGGGGVGSTGTASETDSALALDGIDYGQDEDLFTFGDDTGNESSMGGLKLFGGYLASGTNGPVEFAAETDTSFALSGVQLRAAGLSTETDTALALSAVSVRAVGMASETDTALALAGLQSRAAGRSDETDTALGLGSSAGSSAGVAVETDSALALSGVQIRAVGLAAETDTALARAALQVRGAGVATEADASLALSRVQIRAAGSATETDTALALSPGVANSVGRADEADSAFALGGRHIRAVGLATETDTALALSVAISGQAGVAIETDAAFARAAILRRAVGLCTETDTAFALLPAGFTTYTESSRGRIGLPADRVMQKRIGGKVAAVLGGRIGSGRQ